MKKILFLVSICFLGCQYVFTQTIPGLNLVPTQWKTDGNMVDDSYFMGTKNQFPLIFKTNNLEKMRITTDGNIGIGTTTPEGKLDVFGNAIFRNNLSLPNLQLSTSFSAKTLLVSDAVGNISKVSFNQLLTDIYLPNTTCLTNTNGDVLQPTWSNGTNKIYTACPQVNVGLNTDAPRVRLDVQGITFSNRLALGLADPLNMSNSYFYLKAPSNYPTSQKLFMIQGSNNQELFSVDNFGKVAFSGFNIRNPLPSSAEVIFEINNAERQLLRLDNNGFLRVRRLRIDQSEWADYVFAANYKLMPLCDVKKYVVENKHLPDVPSEEEVKTNGVDLETLNKIYLQKIEELFLYTIEQKEELDLLKKELEELKVLLKK